MARPASPVFPEPGPAQPEPFCAGAFLDYLPRCRPTVDASWCDVFSHCLGMAVPIESALAAAHRSLLRQLDRLPDTVPGNAALQAQIDGLQRSVGSFAMSRYPAGGHEEVLETLLELLDVARRLERRLGADYRQRWVPAHLEQPRPPVLFSQLTRRPSAGNGAQALR